MSDHASPEDEVAHARDLARAASADGATVEDLLALSDAPVRILANAGEALALRREAEVAEMLAVLGWCDLHGEDPVRPDGAPRPARTDEPAHRTDRTSRGPDGRERLVQLGGEGTPQVRDLALLEMGLALEKHPRGVRAMAADALDLRHRLPATWRKVLDGRGEMWVARRVAVLSRNVPHQLVDKVDAQVSGVIGGVAAGRCLDIALGAVIVAHPWGHRADLADARSKRYVTLAKSESTGVRNLVARLASGDALYVDAMVERVADILAAQREAAGTTQKLARATVKQTRDHLRAEAMGWLARPAELLALLAEHADDDPTPTAATEAAAGAPDETDPEAWMDHERRRPTTEPVPPCPGAPDDLTDQEAEDLGEPETPTDPDQPTDQPAQPVEPEGEDEQVPADPVTAWDSTALASPFALPADLLARLTPAVLAALRPTATLYVHVHSSALTERDPDLARPVGVARVEGQGPLDVAHLRDLLGPRTTIKVKPVIDTREHHAVDAYEHPIWMRERITLRAPADQFPHATLVSRHVDLDHPAPYVDPDNGGPPGQTTTDSQPLSRTAHRAKTIAGYTVTPTPAGMLWRSRHGLLRLVDSHGRTHTLSPDEADTLLGATAGHDTLDAALDRILDRTRAGAAQRSAVSRTNR